MKSAKEIRSDLKDIRYYYSRKSMFDEARKYTGDTAKILKKVDIYNKAITEAPARLFDLYYSLYVQNHTQESFGELLGYSQQYIQRLNDGLVRFFSTLFNKEPA